MGKRKVKDKPSYNTYKVAEEPLKPETNEKLAKAIHLHEELLVKLNIFLKEQGLGQNATYVVFNAIAAAEKIKKIIDKESE